MTDKYECTHCGACCVVYTGGLSYTEEDLKRWKKKAPWLLDWVYEAVPDLWRNPFTGDECEGQCPWMGLHADDDGKLKSHCCIEHIKPDICREFEPERERCEELRNGVILRRASEKRIKK